MPEKSLINIMRDFENNHNKEMESIKITQVKMHEQIKAMDAKMEERTVRIETKIDTFMDSCDRRYAPILSWSILKAAGGVVGGAIILALLGKILI